MSRLGHIVILFCTGATLRLHAAEMAFPGADWKETTPESQQVNAIKLAAAVEFLKSKAVGDGVRELVIIRNGHLIWKGDNIDKVHGIYGFNWWVNGTKADGQRVWPGAPPGVFAAAGHNNNRCFVIPEWQMVIVRLGLDEGERKITDAYWGEFLRLIGAAAGKDAP